MASNEFKVTVDVGLGIPVEQAERALKIVEWFLNDNSNIDAIGERQLDGSIKLKFANKGEKSGIAFVPVKKS